MQKTDHDHRHKKKKLTRRRQTEIVIMYSFMCDFSRLEHIAHCKAKNQNTV